MGNRKRSIRKTAKKRGKVGDLTLKNAKNVKGGIGTVSPFVPGAAVISSAITKG